MITLEKAIESPIGALMHAQNFDKRLKQPHHSFLATYIMEERRNEVSFFN